MSMQGIYDVQLTDSSILCTSTYENGSLVFDWQMGQTEGPNMAKFTCSETWQGGWKAGLSWDGFPQHGLSNMVDSGQSNFLQVGTWLSETILKKKNDRRKLKGYLYLNLRNLITSTAFYWSSWSLRPSRMKERRFRIYFSMKRNAPKFTAIFNLSQNATHRNKRLKPKMLLEILSTFPSSFKKSHFHSS